MLVETKCVECGKKVLGYASLTGAGIFCSETCYDNYVARFNEHYKRIDEHFKNISKEELIDNLNRCGLHTIEDIEGDN